MYINEPVLILISIILFFVASALLRWILGTDQSLRNQKAIIELLTELSIKNGVDADSVSEIIKKSKGL
jgi:hypothetical protein